MTEHNIIFGSNNNDGYGFKVHHTINIMNKGKKIILISIVDSSIDSSQ